MCPFRYPRLLCAFCVSALLTGCATTSAPVQTDAVSAAAPSTTSADTSVDASTAQTPAVTTTLVYRNETYGFTFVLPQDWTGYTVLSSQWQGLAVDGASTGKVVQTGPELSLRDPRYTAKVPRQDIPILIFTLAQWDALQQEQFHIGAAPIGPSELGRNNKYVFALPARYNFAFPEGYEEVETILSGKPLQTFDPS